MFRATTQGLQGANSERSGTLTFRTFRTWLVAGPVIGHRTKGRGQVRKVRQVNLSNISDLVPCKPHERGPEPSDKANSERFGKLTFRTFRTWPYPLVLRPCSGPARGQVRKVRQVNVSDLSDPACCKPRERAHNQRTRPRPNGPNN